MSDRTILVPVDGSTHSNEGLEYAYTEYPDAEFVVLHVVELTDFGSETGADTFEKLERWVERRREEAQRIVDEAAATGATYDVPVSTVTRIGLPTETIVAYAEARDVDHVIMGSHGRTGDPGVPIGSVAESVTYESPILVTVVR